MTPSDGVGSGWPLVTVDIDGTLTRVHGWKVIAERLGRSDAFERSQRRFFDREVGEDEHLEEMLRLAEGRTVPEIEAALETTPRIEGIAEGVRWFRGRGTRVALLTHNPPYVCEWYCRRFGFDDYEGTGGGDLVDGRIGAPTGVRADKPSGLGRLVSRAGTTRDRVVHIGDGWADAAVFPLVGRGVALNSTLPEVDRVADLVIRTDDFRVVVREVAALGPRR